MLNQRYLLLLWSFIALVPFVTLKAAETNTLNVMTYNVRYAGYKPPNAWPDRRPILVECVRSLKPDIMGTQEGMYQQIKDMAADMPEFNWIGTGREGGSRNEFMAIFYRVDRFEPLEYDHFWLSDTPDVIGSSTWGNTNKRMVTWVKFRDKNTKKEFYVINTHFDRQSSLRHPHGSGDRAEGFLAYRREAHRRRSGYLQRLQGDRQAGSPHRLDPLSGDGEAVEQRYRAVHQERPVPERSPTGGGTV
ncbi:MAG: Endonuclease/exonuclease/phosphatase [Verrucomicrobia bacterium]|nr:Endonuclease/exonuclease/phosphatase [Verrucomicrobiota bacterium]